MEKRIKRLGKCFFLTLGVLGAASLTGCAEDVSALFGSDGTAVEVVPSFSQREKIITRGADNLDNGTSGFSNTSAGVCIKVDQNDNNYQRYQYTVASGGKAVTPPASGPTFPSGGTSVNVYGWYPYNSGNTSFTIQGDQKSDANYCLSDLMLADKAVCSRNLSTGVVTAAALSFRHVMAKVKVVLNPQSGITVSAVKLKNVLPTVSINESNVSALTVGSASGDAIEVTLLSGGSITSSSTTTEKTLCGVFPEQTFTSAFLVVTAKTSTGSNTDITYSFTGAGKTFEKNNEYVVNLSISPQSLEENEVSLEEWQSAGNNPVNIGGGGGLELQTSASGNNGYVTIAPISDQAYTSSAITPKPSVSVKINNVSIPLTEGTDFDYSYANNTNAGVATVSVTGKGIFSGTVSTNFNISACQGSDISTAAVGSIICSHGKVHAATYDNLTTCGGHKVAIVAYLGTAGTADKSSGSSSYKGLALAITDVGGAPASTFQWYTTNSGRCITNAQSITWSTAANTTNATSLGWMTGIQNTNRLAEAKCDEGHVHAAAQAAVGYESTDPHPSGTSQWFLPTMAQWKLMLESIRKNMSSGDTYSLSNSNQDAFKSTAFQSWFDARGGKNFEAGPYWSSVEYSGDYAWDMFFDGGRAGSNVKYSDYRVRPVLAF